MRVSKRAPKDRQAPAQMTTGQKSQMCQQILKCVALRRQWSIFAAFTLVPGLHSHVKQQVGLSKPLAVYEIPSPEGEPQHDTRRPRRRSSGRGRRVSRHTTIGEAFGLTLADIPGSVPNGADNATPAIKTPIVEPSPFRLALTRRGIGHRAPPKPAPKRLPQPKSVSKVQTPSPGAAEVAVEPETPVKRRPGRPKKGSELNLKRHLRKLDTAPGHTPAAPNKTAGRPSKDPNAPKRPRGRPKKVRPEGEPKKSKGQRKNRKLSGEAVLAKPPTKSQVGRSSQHPASDHKSTVAKGGVKKSKKGNLSATVVRSGSKAEPGRKASSAKGMSKSIGKLRETIGQNSGKGRHRIKDTKFVNSNPSSILKPLGGVRKVSESKQRAKDFAKSAKKTLPQKPADRASGKCVGTPALTKEAEPQHGMLRHNAGKPSKEAEVRLAEHLRELSHKAQTKKAAKNPVAPQKESRLDENVTKLKATLKLAMSPPPAPRKPLASDAGAQKNKVMDADKRKTSILENVPRKLEASHRAQPPSSRSPPRKRAPGGLLENQRPNAAGKQNGGARPMKKQREAIALLAQTQDLGGFPTSPQRQRPSSDPLHSPGHAVIATHNQSEPQPRGPNRKEDVEISWTSDMPCRKDEPVKQVLQVAKPSATLDDPAKQTRAAKEQKAARLAERKRKAVQEFQTAQKRMSLKPAFRKKTAMEPPTPQLCALRNPRLSLDSV